MADNSLTRPSWDEYFLTIARAIATRADCRRRQHGAVIVLDHRIVSTGYNGSPAGSRLSCLDGGCPRGLLTDKELPSLSGYDSGPGRCIAIHAEQNALLYANRTDCHGAVLYVTGQPCPTCFKLMWAARIREVVWPDDHRYLSDALNEVA